VRGSNKIKKKAVCFVRNDNTMRILSQLGFGIKLGGSRVMAQATCINVERAVMLQGVMGIVRGPNHFHHPPQYRRRWF